MGCTQMDLVYEKDLFDIIREMNEQEEEKKMTKRQRMVVKYLRELGSATANELAHHMFREGVVPYFSRNFVHPRLTELIKSNKVEIVGKKVDKMTLRPCSIYKLKGEK